VILSDKARLRNCFPAARRWRKYFPFSNREIGMKQNMLRKTPGYPTWGSFFPDISKVYLIIYSTLINSTFSPSSTSFAYARITTLPGY
jgi:hypothetical protein